jgi:predicted Zn-dependent protease with MMP-like domain
LPKESEAVRVEPVFRYSYGEFLVEGSDAMDIERTAEALMSRFEKIVERLRAGRRGEAIEEFGRIGGLLRSERLEIPDRLLYAIVDAFLDFFRQAGRDDLVSRAAEKAMGALGEDPDLAFARSEALFNLGRFDEARNAFETLERGDFDEPMMYYYLACIAERKGEHRKAKTLFEKAHGLDPETCALPVAVTGEEALRVYRECLAELPGEIARFLEDVPIYVDDLPSDELIRMDDPPLDPLVLGVFLGSAAGEERSSWPDAQPRIVLFHRNIAKAAGDRELLGKELRTTLFHEVGHAIGLDEDRLAEMGLG